MLTLKQKFTITLTATALVINAHLLAQDQVKTTANANANNAAKVRLNRYDRIIASPYVTWGLKHDFDSSINVYPAWKVFKPKKEIIIAVVDTGIDPHHPLVAKNIANPLKGKRKLASKSRAFGLDFSKGSSQLYAPNDQNGHGTHIAGIIKSVFPDVKMLALKYYNPEATGLDNLASTLKALKYAVDANVDVINYSGGGPEPSIEEFRILKEAETKGILIVAAAGNNHSNIDVKRNAYYPASYNLSNIITVTAHDQQLNILPSSNYGKMAVDMAAPGKRIISALPMGRYGYLTGTSQATAFVSGVAGLMKAMYPELTPQQVRKFLIQTAKKERSLANSSISGGRVDAGAALKAVILANGSQDEQNSLISKKKSIRTLALKRKSLLRNKLVRGKSRLVIPKTSDTHSAQTGRKTGKIIYRL